ncbi:MAG: hypothetical protein EAZ08_01355 [Cytophagales bacterium]|nr:MAG: hypothetical protein EAZ08_01355 [Cytophagales bacterium]
MRWYGNEFAGGDIKRNPCIIEIETNLKQSIIKQFSDSLVAKNIIKKIPDKWDYLTENIGNQHLDLKVYYFDENPEEMYVVEFRYMVPCINMIYNEKLKDWWIYNDENIDINHKELFRMKKRFTEKIIIPITNLSNAHSSQKIK